MTDYGAETRLYVEVPEATRDRRGTLSDMLQRHPITRVNYCIDDREEGAQATVRACSGAFQLSPAPVWGGERLKRATFFIFWPKKLKGQAFP